jgi:hypothetical protein
MLQLSGASSLAGAGPNMSQAELTAFLSRAITMSGFLSPNIGTDLRTSKNVSDSIRILTNTGAKYAGRSIFLWGSESILPRMVKAAAPNAAAAHLVDPGLILEGAIFEIVTKAGTEKLTVPNTVFNAFGLPVPLTPRQFNYSAMLFPDGTFVNKWGADKSVPDLTQREAQMWFFYVASQYIEVGVEALHLGQIALMSSHDHGMLQTSSLLKKIRDFASQHARRGFVLCNAHVYEDPYVHVMHTKNLVFDFHAFPSRPKPNISEPQHCTLAAGFKTAMYGKSAGGVSVSGWSCDHLPYLVELDNYDCTNHPGTQDPKDLSHPFGWDEISWFAHQPAKYRDKWLAYVVEWLKRNDPVGHFEMPGLRCLCDQHFENRTDVNHYSASGQDPIGFSQEAAIKAAWS